MSERPAVRIAGRATDFSESFSMLDSARDWFDLVGHASFALAAASFLATRLLWLRVLAIGSLTLGLVYNFTVASAPSLWMVLFWLAALLAINAAAIAREVVGNMEVPLPVEDKQLLAAAFPRMHSRDWLAIKRIGSVRSISPDEVLLDCGQATQAVSLLLDGSTEEFRESGSVIARKPGMFWGELSFAMGDQFGGSPCRIVATGSGRVLDVPYPALREAGVKNPRLLAALNDGFVRSAGVKHSLLRRVEVPMPGETITEELLIGMRRALGAAPVAARNFQRLS